MIWDTSIWRLGCSNHSKIRSAQKCYPCLRYVVSPMSPGRTEAEVARPGRFELPTLCLEGRRSIQLSYGRLTDSKRFAAPKTIICYVLTLYCARIPEFWTQLLPRTRAFH